MAIAITSLRLGTSVCQYNPDGTPRKILHTVVAAGVNLAYCDTIDEAAWLMEAIREMQTTCELVP